jgi:hypothetical protein
LPELKKKSGFNLVLYESKNKHCDERKKLPDANEPGTCLEKEYESISLRQRKEFAKIP